MPVTIAGGVTQTNQPLALRLCRQQVNYYVRAMRQQTALNAAYREQLVSALEQAALGKQRQLKKRLDETGDDAHFQSSAYRQALRDWDNRQSLMNESAAEALRGYQAVIREKIATALGVGSLTRGALNPQVSATLTRTGYKIDKLVYESLPGWFVSANFYYPTTPGSTPAPGVILMPGHATEAKHYYQDYAQGLAKLGYCCLAIDAVGSGERLQLPSSSTVLEHADVGRQMPLVGKTIAGIMAWDASRGVDYMLTRADVDPDHIGATGTSGGGTQTVLLTAFDSRLTMVATSCFVDTFQRNLENELWADHEQVPPLVIGDGLDVDDFLILHAPKPLMVIGQLLDYFDIRGLRTAFDRIERIYDLVGAPDDACQLFVDTNDHQLDKDGREAGYRLFNYAVGGGHGVVEPSIALENPVSALWATATGDVNVLPGAKKSTDLLAAWVDEAEALQGNPTGFVLATRVREVLRLPPDSTRGTPPEFRIWEQYVNWTNDGVGITPAITPPNYPTTHCCVFAVETDEDVLVPTYYLRNGSWHSPPPTVAVGTRAILYVPHLSADQELSQPGREPLITSTIAAEPSTAFFAVDVRGTGESQTVTNGVFNTLSTGDDFFAELADALGEPLLGRCVWDILRVVDFLGSYGYTSIYVIGRGWGSIPAALAALLEPRITQVRVKNALTRWRAAARAQPLQMAWPMSRLLYDAIRHFDLPHVYADLASKPLGFVNDTPWGAWGGLGGET